jgi:hypothetical protein
MRFIDRDVILLIAFVLLIGAGIFINPSNVTAETECIGAFCILPEHGLLLMKALYFGAAAICAISIYTEPEVTKNDKT